MCTRPIFLPDDTQPCVLMCTCTLVLMVRFSQSTFSGSESLGKVPVTLLLEGGTSDRDISVTVTPSDQSPASAEGKRCVS